MGRENYRSLFADPDYAVPALPALGLESDSASELVIEPVLVAAVVVQMSVVCSVQLLEQQKWLLAR